MLLVYFRLSAVVLNIAVYPHNTLILLPLPIRTVSEIRYGIRIKPPEYGTSNTERILLGTLVTSNCNA